MATPRGISDTREHILRAALKTFAECGYAAASVQQIVDAAKVSKPSLYYYFKDKAGLFEALVERAHTERYELLKQASDRGFCTVDKLREMAVALFDYSAGNGALMRLAFSTAFAAAGEVPGRTKCREKGKRNYEFVRGLIQGGQEAGELTSAFTADELAMGYYGQLNTYIMVRLLLPESPLDRRAGERIVELFLQGAKGKVAGSGSRGKRDRMPRLKARA